MVQQNNKYKRTIKRKEIQDEIKGHKMNIINLKKKLHVYSSRAPGQSPWAPLHFVGALLECMASSATSKTFH